MRYAAPPQQGGWAAPPQEAGLPSQTGHAPQTGHAAQTGHAPQAGHAPAAPPAASPEANAWPAVCEQFSQQVLLLSEQLRPAMDQLESEEEDADRLQLLYQVDHAVTRMRRAAREMSVLAGGGSAEMGGHTTSLVDVVRLAESSIERYTQVVIGKVVQLAVVPYASDDVASLLVVLLDNATRYSPSAVTVSAHLLDNGAVMMRIEDKGIGIAPDRLQGINAMLSGPVPPIGADTARHTGFPVAHRLAAKHGIGVGLACRPATSGSAQGTVAMVVIPPALLCELEEEPPAPPRPAAPAAPHPGGAVDRSLAHLRAPERVPDHLAEPAAQPLTSALDPLPRRESMSLRRAEAAPDAGASLRAEGAPGRETAARSFAEDLEAFTSGVPAADRHEADDPPEGRAES
ncbi:ATP-binding protein [Actinomadura sp. B10D3]|uniref:ATP-binding protein n=1 Tax=Actinomadura sp. B10D3 TaxID=3153557 RepID=UPI00325D9933